MQKRAAGPEQLTEIPYLELDVIVLHRLHVEPDRCSNTRTPSHQVPPNPTQQVECAGGVDNSESELTWDRGDDLPHLQPICEGEPKHTSGSESRALAGTAPQIRRGPAVIRGGRGDETGGARLTEYGGLAGIVEAQEEDGVLWAGVSQGWLLGGMGGRGVRPSLLVACR